MSTPLEGSHRYPPLSNADSIRKKLSDREEKIQDTLYTTVGLNSANPVTSEELARRAMAHYKQSTRSGEGSLPVDPKVIASPTDPEVLKIAQQITAGVANPILRHPQ